MGEVKFKYGLLYDIGVWPLERLIFASARPEIFKRVGGGTGETPLRLLEVGIGTGINIPHYPKGVEVTGIDISPGMLKRAARRAGKLNWGVNLQVMDSETLQFPDSSFDVVISTLVFCSVVDPKRGLGEIRRVLVPEGRLIMMEHVRPGGPILGPIFDKMTRLTDRLFGDQMNRDTVRTVMEAGFTVEEDLNIYRDIVKLIVARPDLGKTS